MKQWNVSDQIFRNKSHKCHPYIRVSIKFWRWLIRSWPLKTFSGFKLPCHWSDIRKHYVKRQIKHNQFSYSTNGTLHNLKDNKLHVYTKALAGFSCGFCSYCSIHRMKVDTRLSSLTNIEDFLSFSIQSTQSHRASVLDFLLTSQKILNKQ